MSPPLLQGVSVLKPVIQAGLNAILPVFGGSYTDEMGHPFEVQMRGKFSTERRNIPNVTVGYRPGRATLFSGQGIIGLDPDSGMYLYGIYLFDGRLNFTVQGRNEAEREWLIDTLATGFTGLVFADPNTGRSANNNLVDYLFSQGVVATGWDTVDYPDPVVPDEASPRPEGQVYEATLPVIVDVSLAYLMPGVSTAGATLTNSFSLSNNPPLSQPWQPNPGVEPSIFLSH